MTTEPTDTKRDKMIRRVQALLAQSVSTNYEPEAEAFEEHALRLMATYEIEERELRDADPHALHEIPLGHFGNAQTGACVLVAQVYKMFGGFAVRSMDNRKATMKVMATPSVVELATPLLDHLLAHLQRDILADRPRSRMSYAIGWTEKVVTRLEAAQERIYSESTALVPTTDAAKAAYHDQVGRTTSSSIAVTGDYRTGQAAGTNADLGQTRVGAAR